MKTRLFAFAAVTAAALALSASPLSAMAAPTTAPANPAKPATGPTAPPPTLPTAPEDATPATPAAPATPKVIPPAPTAEPPTGSKEPAPAFRAGAKVSDSTGADIGVIQSIAEASTGAMIVLQVDGKLVSVPQGTLSPFGENVKSSQTKAQILAATPKP
jgi:hypothetical protein